MSIESLLEANFNAMSKEDLVVKIMALHNNQKEMLRVLEENTLGDFNISREKVEEVENVLSNILTMSKEEADTISQRRELEKQLDSRMNSLRFTDEISFQEIFRINKAIKEEKDSLSLHMLMLELRYHQKHLKEGDFFENFNSLVEESYESGQIDKDEGKEKDFNSSINLKDSMLVKYNEIKSIDILYYEMEKIYNIGYLENDFDLNDYLLENSFWEYVE